MSFGMLTCTVGLLSGGWDLGWHQYTTSSHATTLESNKSVDDLMSHLSGAELKVLLYIIRRTFGFKKDADNISLSQLLNGIVTRDGRRMDYGVGLSKPTLLTALSE